MSDEQCPYWQRGRYVHVEDKPICMLCKQHVDAPIHTVFRARRAELLREIVRRESSWNPTTLSHVEGIMQPLPRHDV